MDSQHIDDSEFDKSVEIEISSLLTNGYVGFYTHCEITQIVLQDKQSEVVYNYFTHVDFDQSLTMCQSTRYVTEKPLSINGKYRLMISKYTISIERFKMLILSAYKTQRWEYRDECINEDVLLDDVYPTGRKYVPSNDPTGCQYGLKVPIEWSLYRSNIFGNYYIYELYSPNKLFKASLSRKDIIKIQESFDKYRIPYNFSELFDRIGNVLCRFKSEVLTAKPKALGDVHGISYELTRAKECKHSDEYLIQMLVEHDRLVYNNRIEKIIFDDNGKYTFSIYPNQCKNTIIVTNQFTDLIAFMEVLDYSVYSNYRSQITPPYTIYQCTDKKTRCIEVDGVVKIIPLRDESKSGSVSLCREMNEAGIRQQLWEDVFFGEMKYIISYVSSSHEKAIDDIKDIINGPLLWDIEEILVIDPYLKPEDILCTVVFCEKEKVKIRCLTDVHAICGNQETRESFPNDTNGMSIQDTKKNYKRHIDKYSQDLSRAIPPNIDLQLEYRSRHNNHGMKFHDRYLILKFGLNKTRAWSLGTSINSLGKSHHIIQIIEAPKMIADVFERIWADTQDASCLIYKTPNAQQECGARIDSSVER